MNAIRKALVWWIPAGEICMLERPLKTPRIVAYAITITEENTQGIQHPYNDPLVIMLAIANFTIHRVLVDNGSSEEKLSLTS